MNPTGGIVVTTRYPALRFMDAMYAPGIFLDGYEVARGWGRQVFTSWTGRHHINVHSRSMGTNMWNADIIVDVYPNQWVELEFMAPNNVWNPFNTKASLYHVPRR